jgi:hypothetical protein
MRKLGKINSFCSGTSGRCEMRIRFSSPDNNHPTNGRSLSKENYRNVTPNLVLEKLALA